MPPPPRVLTADRGDERRRIDLVLRRHLTDLHSATRTRVQSWIEKGLVTVNGAAVRRVSTRAAFGDIIAVTLPEEAPRAAMVAEDVRLDVLYEDDQLLAIDKPAGLVVHPTYKHAAGTLMNALLWHARAWPAPQRPSLVSRLDKLTSGIVIVAKTAAVHAALQRAMATPLSSASAKGFGERIAASAKGFGEPGPEKDYLAIVYGRVNVARGEIDLRLGKDRGDRRKVVASPEVGAESLTRFERLARVAAPRAGLSLLRCRLATGRTHQIRVHLAARGWPIVGDPAYGDPRWSQIVDPLLAATLRAFPRQALHAWRVAFTHPITRARLTIEAPVPVDLEALLEASGLSAPFRIRASRHHHAF
jgi:23S rRNA pseudouridine1911/1915/1917 synthase